jgi:hypothetical protein
MTDRYKLYDYVNEKGVNEFREWTKTLQKNDLAKLNAKLDMLRREPELPPNLLAGPIDGLPIYKIRVNGQVALRPMLCKGPVNNEKEFTLLFGAKEQNRVLVPSDAVIQAAARRVEVKSFPAKRRVDHERVTWGNSQRSEER